MLNCIVVVVVMFRLVRLPRLWRWILGLIFPTPYVVTWVLDSLVYLVRYRQEDKKFYREFCVVMASEKAQEWVDFQLRSLALRVMHYQRQYDFVVNGGLPDTHAEKAHRLGLAQDIQDNLADAMRAFYKKRDAARRAMKYRHLKLGQSWNDYAPTGIVEIRVA